MDQTTFENDSGVGNAFYGHNYHELPERDSSVEIPRKNQGKYGSYSNPASPGYREMPPRDYSYNLQQGNTNGGNNGSGGGRPPATYPPIPKKDYSNEIASGKAPTNESIDGDKLNQLIELINQMPKFNNAPPNVGTQSAINPHTAMETDIHNAHYLVPQLTFGPPNSDTVIVSNQRKKKFAWPKLRKGAYQQASCQSNVQLNVSSGRGYGMDMEPRCKCNSYCDMEYCSGDPNKSRGECCLKKICKVQNQMVPKIVMVPYGSSSTNINAGQEATSPSIGRRNVVAAPVSVGVDANSTANNNNNDSNKVDNGVNVDNQNTNTNCNGNVSNNNANNNGNGNNNNNANNANNGGTCVLTGDVASTVVGLNSIAAINGLCASVNALNGALGGLSGSIGNRNFGAGVGCMNGGFGVGGINGGMSGMYGDVCANAMNSGIGGGMEDMTSRFGRGSFGTSRMIGGGGGYTGGGAFGGARVRSSRVYGGSYGNLNTSLSGQSREPVFPASYSRYGTSNTGSAYDIRYIEPDMDDYRQRVREAEENAQRRRQELISKRDAEVAQKRQQAEYEVAQETARRKADAERRRNEEVQKKIAEAHCTRKRKEQELMQLFCQKLKVLRDLEAKKRAQYERALAEANQRGAPIRQQIALTQRCIQEMEAYKAHIQAQECERKSHLAMLSQQLESICVPAYHADTGSEKSLLAEFCQKLSVIKCEENEKVAAAENTPMPTYEIPQMPEIPIPEIPEIEPEPVAVPEYRAARVRHPSCQPICTSMTDLPSICCPPPQPICCPPIQPVCCPQPAYCCPMPTTTFGIMPISPVACYQPPPQPISYYCPPPPCCATYSQPLTPEPTCSPCSSSSCCKPKPCTKKPASSPCRTKTTCTPSCCQKTRTAPVRSKSSCCLARKPKDVCSEDECYELQPSDPCRRSSSCRSGTSCCLGSSCCCRRCGQPCRAGRRTCSSPRCSGPGYSPTREVVVCAEQPVTRTIEEPIEEFKPACEVADN
ncbi:conserved hypothetical protein [Echinococcus multilocularis]|uniref:Uncharacterized protein n=1 Tax=Echinococcus multilocularis TaxID=6211 RepID=A0A068Y3C7_ECHMU|nr:conserved hypothetical protein [Echinococcus multilocularis]